MWDTQTDSADGNRPRRVRILHDGEPLSYGETIERWRSDDAFRTLFIGLLAGAPYDAYLWETPPITRQTLERTFEFVLVDCPALADLAPEPDAFAGHFRDVDSRKAAAVFPNLSSDALLVAPTPQSPVTAYPHIAAFARTAPGEQQHEFWRSVGAAVAERLDDRPLWLSTNGLGVAWLHVRLDSRPKYYSFEPYRMGA